MAALIVVNGHATVTMTMSNDDLRHLMDDVTARSWTGQGFCHFWSPRLHWSEGSLGPAWLDRSVPVRPRPHMGPDVDAAPGSALGGRGRDRVDAGPGSALGGRGRDRVDAAPGSALGGRGRDRVDAAPRSALDGRG